MKKSLKLASATLLISSLPSYILAQAQSSDGGSESAAEASVTTSSSKKSAAAPETIESNPVVTVVKAGLPFSAAKNVSVANIVKIAQAGGTLTNLKSSASAISLGKASVINIVLAVDAGIKFSSAGGAGFLDVAEKIEKGQIKGSASVNLTTLLADVRSNLNNGVDLDAQIDFGITDTKTAVQAGYTPADILETTNLNESDKAARKAVIDRVSAQVVAAQGSDNEVDKDELESIVGSGDGDITEAQINAAKYATTVKALSSNSLLTTAIDNVLADADYSGPELQAALTEAVKIADIILADVSITSSTSLPSPLNLKSLDDSGYNTELVKLLVNYGAIGDKGSTLAAAAIDGFSSTSSTSNKLTDLLSSNSNPNSADFIGLLSTLTGDSGIGDSDGDNNDFLNPSKNTVLKVNLEQVNLISGSNIAIESTDTDSKIDVSSYLEKASNHANRKILVIGAAKDLILKGNVKFHNNNDVEDHALVLGAADELYFRSVYNSSNSDDYYNPDKITLEYTGSNLGLGSESEMRLINVDIKTGGNLSIGTLNNLYIGQENIDNMSTFSVGTGGKNSDADNIYMYANELIKVNGLSFAGRVDDIYMDAITIDLGNVTFPNHSDVLLRSRDGGLNFGQKDRAVGDVNFIENVKYHNTTLTESHFSGVDGHINSEIKLPNGRQAIKIRKR